MTYIESRVIQNACAAWEKGDPFYFHNPQQKLYATATYFAHQHHMLCTWQGFVTPQDIEQFAESLLQFMHTNTVLTLINENRLVEGPWYDANEWVVHNWLPRARRFGLVGMAQIISTDEYAAISARELIGGIGTSFPEFDAKVFISMAEAELWRATVTARHQTGE